MVVEAVEARFDVTFHEPHRTFEIDVNMLESGVAATPWPETMGVWREIGFIYTFKNHADNFLHQLVRCGRDAQRPFLAAVFLGDVLPSGRMRLIAVVFERCDDFLNALITHIVAAPKRRGKSYNKWQGSKPPSHRDRLRMAIDAALAQKPASLDALLQLLWEAGIEVSPRGKSIRLKMPGQERFVRLDEDSLGEGYGIEALSAVLAGKKAHKPVTKKIHRADPPKVNLLVDIQAKLQAGKGTGYARWAKTFNLKQMAQTLNYLTEHGLLDYADLTARADEATGHYHELSAKIKAAEKRMAEIAVLKTHIINYAKTRDTYAAYRKAGYSKKFKAEHESEILLHQAAKKFFDDAGLKKLPSVKSLQAEYAALLAEKKEAYADYRKAREEMKELLTIRANVQKLMGYEAQEQEKEADRREGER